MTRCNVPVIARVNGYALGGGFEMVLGCDLVVACDEASFGLPEALVGRMPLDGGMTLLQRQIPYRQAMAMLTTRAAAQQGVATAAPAAPVAQAMEAAEVAPVAAAMQAVIQAAA